MLSSYLILRLYQYNVNTLKNYSLLIITMRYGILLFDDIVVVVHIPVLALKTSGFLLVCVSISKVLWTACSCFRRPCPSCVVHYYRCCFCRCWRRPVFVKDSASIALRLWVVCPCFRRFNSCFVKHYYTHFVVVTSGLNSFSFMRRYLSSLPSSKLRITLRCLL